MLKAYKFRIYPTPEQELFFQKTFGCVRFYYNQALASCIEQYSSTGKSRIPTPATFKKEFEFLKEVDSLALCNAQLHLQAAYNNFFRNIKKGKKEGFPNFKSKKISKKSYTTNNSGQIRISRSKLKLPKVGLVEIVLHRKIDGVIRSVTVSQKPNGHYFVSILTDRDLPIIEKEIDQNNVVGIDMSFSECAVLSSGEKANFQRIYRQSEKVLAKAQRNLSRKVKGSKNREKARVGLAVKHCKIASKRQDFLHKLSFKIAETYDIVVVEDIDLQAMSRRTKGRKFGKSIADIGFGMLRSYLSYKLVERGKLLVKADRFFPSSQLCSSCGYKNIDTKNLAIRQWICPSCGTNHNRDINAGNNLVNWYKSTAASAESYACGDCVRPQSEAVVEEAGKVAEEFSKLRPSGRRR